MPSYTEAITLGSTGGVIGVTFAFRGFVNAITVGEQFSSIVPPNSDASASVAVYVRYARQPDNAPLTMIYVAPGKILPIRAKYVEYMNDGISSILLLN